MPVEKISLPAPELASSARGDVSWVYEALALSRHKGFIGNVNLRDVVEHSMGYVAIIQAARDSVSAFSQAVSEPYRLRIVDVGSGGGIPGIPIGWYLRDADVTLLESSSRRVNFLYDILSTSELSYHVSAAHARAELYGREEIYRGAFQFAVARSLAPPATTAELCAPLLAVGGKLIVSLDPSRDSILRLWPESGLTTLGLQKTAEVTVGRYRYLMLTQMVACSDKYPRRPGMPSKRPLF